MIRRQILPSHLFIGFVGVGLTAVAPLPLSAQSAHGFVFETEAEFHTVADVDGDGIDDLVVVDKTSGQFRIATGENDGALTWRENSGNSGLTDVTGFSAGPLLHPDRDALVFAAPFANRIQLIDASSDNRLTAPVRVPTEFIGPSILTALQLPGGAPDYSDEFYDIVYHATLHTADSTNVVSQLRNRDGKLPFPEFGAFEAAGLPRRPNRISLETGSLPAYGVIEEAGGESAFHLYDPTVSPIKPFATAPRLPLDANYVYADFDGDDFAEFLYFVPGSNLLHESAWDGSQLTTPTSIEYGKNIGELRVIDSGGQPELLIIYADGASAVRVDYDGNGLFTVLETFHAPSDQTFNGAMSLGSHLHLLTGAPGGRSGNLETYAFKDGKHFLVENQSLTPLSSNNHDASVLLFDSPPLTNPNAVLLSQLQAGPWTSAFSLTSTGAEVISEIYQGPDSGLGNHQRVNLDTAPPSTGGGLTNQLSPDLSLRFNTAPIGEVTTRLTVEPGSGTYSRAIRPTLTATGDAATIQYRTTQNPEWTDYAAEPPVITTDTLLYAVARSKMDNAYSNVVRVHYQFTGDPGNRDSNQDGIPDFVAQALGLDPLAANLDADGDGFTDFQEVIAGTDPLDPLSTPDRTDDALQYPNAFNLIAAPGVPDPSGGSSLLRSFAAGGAGEPTGLTVHQPNGFYLGSADTETTPELPVPAAYFEALDIIHSDLFVIATTETHFPVNDSISRDYGRQTAAIVSIPDQEFQPFVYERFGSQGGYSNLLAEAKAWQLAAEEYYNSLTRETIAADPVGPESTLSLLLVEHFLGEQLHARGLSDRANVSLTPFRENENPLSPEAAEASTTTRDRSVAIADLLALQRSSDISPSYKIREIVSAIETSVATAPSPNIAQLVELAHRLYLTSATNQEPGSLLPPFDALRHFIRSGHLDGTGYENIPDPNRFPSSLLADATLGIAEVTELIPERVVQTIAIYYDGSPVTNCQTWQEVVYNPGAFDPEAPVTLATEYALIDDRGNPFPISRAFPLTAGSVFEVTGFVETATTCGDLALEVIPEPRLVHLQNASPTDSDGNLIPDSVQNLTAATDLAPFADTDGDKYPDLQEVLTGSDPTDSASFPTDSGAPAPILDLTPPQVRIESNGSNSATVSFDYPANIASHLNFELLSSTDLQTFSSTGLQARQTSGTHHELTLSAPADREFYIFRMTLK